MASSQLTTLVLNRSSLFRIFAKEKLENINISHIKPEHHGAYFRAEVVVFTDGDRSRIIRDSVINDCRELASSEVREYLDLLSDEHKFLNRDDNIVNP